MSNMKQVDTRGLQHNLGRYLDQVEQGETIEIRRRRKVIARIVPFVAEEPEEPWPDLEERLNHLFPDGPVSESGSDRLYQDRERS